MVSHFSRAFFLWFLLSFSTKLVADGEFRIFSKTASPDGAYVLGWGDGEVKESDFAGMKQVSDDQKHFDVENDEIANFLISTGKKQPVAVIPEFHYFAGPEGHQNHRDISAAWSSDSRKALLIYHGRYSYESVLWLEVEKRRMTQVGKQLERALRKVIDEKEPKKLAALAGSLSFSNATISGADNLAITGCATSAAEKDLPLVELLYDMKFKIIEGKEGVSFQLAEAKSSPTQSGGK